MSSIFSEKNSSILLSSKLENLPDKPGVYFFKNEEGSIIYVGKSKFLKRRVASYFRIHKFGGTKDEILYGQKLHDLVSEVVDIEIIVTESEKEALLLENNMIKKFQPIYNVMLRDDKNFPWIVITYSEQFPRIRVIRAPRNQPDFDEKNKLIGPYIDVKPMKDTLKLLRKHFPYCSCSGPCKEKDRPCINYQLGLCPAPCANKITAKVYLENIKSLDKILSGDIEEIIIDLHSKMKISSENMQFEEAAKNRDAIRALEGMIERQTIINYDNKMSLDVIGFFKTTKKIGILVLHIRNGRLTAKTPTIIETEKKIDKDKEIINSFIEQFYLNENRPLPDEIVLPLNDTDKINSLEELDSLTSVLKDRYGKSLHFRTNWGDDYIQGLMRIAQKNAKIMVLLEDEYEKLSLESEALLDLGMKEDAILKMNPSKRKTLVGLKEIKELFGLEDLPKIIEGFDISTWMMGEAVGALVQFVNGKPLKKNYRSFTIRNQTILGDSNMMFELVSRRYTRLLEEGQPLPDLILIDGGKAQVNAAFLALEKLNISTIPVLGLKKKSIHTQIEEAVFPDERNPIRLKDFTPGYNILQQISQEYHRRAIIHHRKRMEKKIMTPKLDAIPGVGLKIRNLLLEHFKTTDKVIDASLEEMQDLLGKKRGKNIYINIRKLYKSKKVIKLRK
ncbi:MAG: excinuclease ABC subunit UvrC [Candidatus Lokiarchaeota archaeon]|nr:excinuclease ABC subunit UvrC [Candidatus Lokiarchaeota archaeon]